jgi:DNA replication protein DnaC
MMSDNRPNACPVCGEDGICGGLGVISYDVPVGHELFGKLVRCPNNPIEQDTERRERFRKLSNLDALADRTFENFETGRYGLTEKQLRTLEFARQLATDYAENPHGWLVLKGSYGTGKTHLAAAIGNYRLSKGDMVLFITTPDLLDHLRASYSPKSEATYDETFDRVRDAQILILDDLGAENPSEWANEKLFQLLNYRYVNHLPTIVTTNVSMEALDPRVRSRLADENVMRAVDLQVPDYRTPVTVDKNNLNTLNLYRDMTFDSFDIQTKLTREEYEKLYYAKQQAMAYSQHNQQGWLVIMGSFGIGKTHLAAAIANEQDQHGVDVTFITMTKLLDALRDAMGTRSQLLGQLSQAVEEVSLLVLDDLNTETASGWGREKLFQLLDYRYITRKPTIITTTQHIHKIDDRIRSRLLDTRRCTNLPIQAPMYADRLTR